MVADLEYKLIIEEAATYAALPPGLYAIRAASTDGRAADVMDGSPDALQLYMSSIPQAGYLELNDGDDGTGRQRWCVCVRALCPPAGFRHTMQSGCGKC
jgi:hypothetical protein